MPRYTFRCPTCGDADRWFALNEVPDEVGCLACTATTRRRVTAGSLLGGSSSARRLLDATERSAYEPAVVSQPPQSSRRAPATTGNPLHANLPRP